MAEVEGWAQAAFLGSSFPKEIDGRRIGLSLLHSSPEGQLSKAGECPIPRGEGAEEESSEP
jgi:hypothetical protein